jgi:hypothetical protein
MSDQIETTTPQTNGIGERFYRTMQDEFYNVAFRKRLYTSLEQLQNNVDAWITKCNESRPYSGEDFFGKTPEGRQRNQSFEKPCLKGRLKS